MSEIHDHFSKLGKKGGKATAEKYGVEYMRMIARKGGKKKKEKLSTPSVKKGLHESEGLANM